MTEFSFIHAADLHLDAPFKGLGVLSGIGSGTGSNSGPGTAMDSSLIPQETLKRATFLALERLTQSCIACGVDFLLLAGDVYNSADSSLKARLALRDAFVRLQKEGIAVFLAHGNHDPLQAEQGAVPWPDNVHVFGAETSCQTAFARANKEAVALVHGVSHAGPAESRNLAATFTRKPPSLMAPDLFQIGLLHCALAGVSGSHDAYAPCTFADLAEAELDYWALGHVHGCRLFDRQGKALPAVTAPFGHNATPQQVAAAYSGSLQGLHVNESGPHGCLLVRVDAKGRARVKAIPVAPVQWETLRLEPGPGIGDIPSLESLLLERLEALAPTVSGADCVQEQGFAPESIAVRIILEGQSPLHAELADPMALNELRDHVGRELAGSRVWIRDLDATLRPVLDMEAARMRPDLAGEVLRLAESVEGEELLRLGVKALEPLFKRARLRKALVEPEQEELALLLDQAAMLCIELLGPDAAASEDL